MLVLKGKVTYRNLNTTYTYLDQFIAGLQKDQFTGYCTVSFWEYDGILFFVGGKILNGREEKRTRPATVSTGDAAVASILSTGREKGGEINGYALPAERVSLLIAALNGTPKYENLSTDLTSLDRLIVLLKKETLSGYIEVLLENEAGTANLFFVNGELVESVFAPVDSPIIGEPKKIEEIMELCQQNGAVFNVYQASTLTTVQQQEQDLEGTGPSEAIKLLFEAMLVRLESATDVTLKAGAFQTVFKKVLPQVADTYEFLDPFIGDFRYANNALVYSGEATYKEFVDGLCALMNTIVAALLETVPEKTFLPRLSMAFEPVVTQYADLVEQLQLEVRLPKILQDYFFLKDRETEEKKGGKGVETRSVLNLQGIGIPEIGSDSILREFYRVITLIAKKYSGAEGNVIQYANLKKSSEFQPYQTATALLQSFDIAYLKNRNEALAFWINLYNFLAIDGILKFGVTSSVQDTKGFFTKTSYRLGEHLFSLDEIEHGILRNNQRRPYSSSKPFNAGDPRQVFCLTPPDQRIHCCLVYGAKSSPALTIYTPDQLNTQLTQAVNRFLRPEKGMRIERGKNELWLNRVFYWYRKDFEQRGKTLLDFIVETLQDKDTKQFLAQNREKLTLRFMDYDWSLNGK